jgi:predicted GNAT family acetyltransferase
MRVETFTDLARFQAEAGPFLAQDEARHNLQFGILSTLQHHPEVYPVFSLWAVEDGGEVVGAALRTPPYNLVLARPRHHRAIEALVDHLASEGTEIPGVVGAEPEVADFVDVWRTRTGAHDTPILRQGVYRLTSVEPLPSTPGVARVADERDRPLVEAWMEDFLREALPHEPVVPARRRAAVDVRMRASDDGGFWLLEDADDVVSLAGYGGPTPNGIRIGPVFTPTRFRGRGYATKIVSELSADLLARGRRFCFLFTDLANPTSNAIYRRIGYEHVCDAADVRFEP